MLALFILFYFISLDHIEEMYYIIVRSFLKNLELLIFYFILFYFIFSKRSLISTLFPPLFSHTLYVIIDLSKKLGAFSYIILINSIWSITSDAVGLAPGSSAKHD